jgi:AcrR family transcriptional regulator
VIDINFIMAQETSQQTFERLLQEYAPAPQELHKEAAKLTRHRLLVAASECFAEKGYQKTTIREIASNAGVTLGALYHHFKDKKELLMTANRSRQVTTLEITKRALSAENNFFRGLEKAMREIIDLLANNPILRGVTREYWGMGMTDPDMQVMHRNNDLEFLSLYAGELKRCHPSLSPDMQYQLVHMILVASEGLITAVVVESPMAVKPEQIMRSFIRAFRLAMEPHEPINR